MRQPYDRSCVHCGRQGHKAKECDRAPITSVTAALTESEFMLVKDVQRANFLTSEEVADELKLPLPEVNAAFAYVRYGTYLHYRRAKIAV
jgi:hypothetical protein